jgi:hypothetical protein
MIFWILCLGISGLLFLVIPAPMLRWTLQKHPELAAIRSVLLTARLIGLGLIAMSSVMLYKLK